MKLLNPVKKFIQQINFLFFYFKRNNTDYRIIYVLNNESDPCHWQLQKRFLLFFWKDVCLSFSSATTAANEMIFLMEKKKFINTK